MRLIWFEDDPSYLERLNGVLGEGAFERVGMGSSDRWLDAFESWSSKNPALLCVIPRFVAERQVPNHPDRSIAGRSPSIWPSPFITMPRYPLMSAFSRESLLVRFEWFFQRAEVRKARETVFPLNLLQWKDDDVTQLVLECFENVLRREEIRRRLATREPVVLRRAVG